MTQTALLKPHTTTLVKAPSRRTRFERRFDLGRTWEPFIGDRNVTRRPRRFPAESCNPWTVAVSYTRRNLFRMRQFFEAYQAHKKVSPLVTQWAWIHLIILSEAKPVETREFYILAAIKER